MCFVRGREASERRRREVGRGVAVGEEGEVGTDEADIGPERLQESANWRKGNRKGRKVASLWCLVKMHLVDSISYPFMEAKWYCIIFCQRLHTSLYTYFITYARILFLLYHLRHMFPLIR